MHQAAFIKQTHVLQIPHYLLKLRWTSGGFGVSPYMHQGPVAPFLLMQLPLQETTHQTDVQIQ